MSRRKNEVIRFIPKKAKRVKNKIESKFLSETFKFGNIAFEKPNKPQDQELKTFFIPQIPKHMYFLLPDVGLSPYY